MLLWILIDDDDVRPTSVPFPIFSSMASWPPSYHHFWENQLMALTSVLEAWILDCVYTNSTPNIFTHHHYHLQWWDFVTGIFPPYSLLTNSHNGGFLSWWECAGRPWLQRRRWWWWGWGMSMMRMITIRRRRKRRSRAQNRWQTMTDQTLGDF